MKTSERISYNHSPMVLWVSFVAGLGVILMVIALGVGAVQGEAANGTVIGLLLIAGVILFLLGAIAWFGLTQPQKHFDDISQPAPDDHHTAHHDEHALAEVPEHGVQTAGH